MLTENTPRCRYVAKENKGLFFIFFCPSYYTCHFTPRESLVIICEYHNLLKHLYFLQEKWLVSLKFKFPLIASFVCSCLLFSRSTNKEQIFDYIMILSNLQIHVVSFYHAWATCVSVVCEEILEIVGWNPLFQLW